MSTLIPLIRFYVIFHRYYVNLLDSKKLEKYAKEERQIREENIRLQRKLQMEVDRRAALCRHLSESESR